jgi:hypothetical protein
MLSTSQRAAIEVRAPAAAMALLERLQ